MKFLRKMGFPTSLRRSLHLRGLTYLAHRLPACIEVWATAKHSMMVTSKLDKLPSVLPSFHVSMYASSQPTHKYFQVPACARL